MFSARKTISLAVVLVALLAFKGSEGVKHFQTFPRVRYTKIHLLSTSYSSPLDREYSASLKKINKQPGMSLKISFIPNDNQHLIISFYKGKKRIQKMRPKVFASPWGGSSEDLQCADFDGNGFLDMKFQIWSGGCGLASAINSKVYLMNRGDTSFTCFSFCDFADDFEYDIDGDGVYEILSCEYKNYKGHAYWVYNSYNFRNDSLVNNSEKFNYPLWTRYLFESSDKIATAVPDNIRLKARKEHPEDFYISLR